MKGKTRTNANLISQFKIEGKELQELIMQGIDYAVNIVFFKVIFKKNICANKFLEIKKLKIYLSEPSLIPFYFP